MTATALRAAPDAVEAPPVRRRLAIPRRAAIPVGVAVLVAAGGLAFILAPPAAVSTDAAYVEADSAVVAPKVRGLIAQVLVDHDQPVKRGDPLIVIDPEEFDARVQAARADLASAGAAVDAARAALVSQAAEERLAASNVRAAQTLIAAADAEHARAAVDRARYDNLEQSGAVAGRDADLRRTAEVSAGSAADHSRAELAVAQVQTDVTGARRATLTAALAQAQAAIGQRQAALALALQDQAHAIIRAPMDGVVGDRQTEPGEYVQPGA